MSPTTLAIQVEAWLQEELGGQRAVLGTLERVERTVRTVRAGSGGELEACARELERLLASAPPRALRRTRLFETLAELLGLPAGEATLTALATHLAARGVETHRLHELRAQLRAALNDVLRCARRLSALAHYHRGVLEELCALLSAGSADPEGRLVDARA